MIFKRIFLVLFFCCFVLFITACSETGTKSDPNHLDVQLIKVVDGDTINVLVDGKEETVRFLLIDTPESVHPNMPVQPFSKEASQFTKKMLERATVELELGIGQRDKYGRLLAYVYADGESVQEALLKNGLARVAYVFAPNTKYVDEYRSIQKEAQKKGIGIWSIENYVQENGFVDGKEKREGIQQSDQPVVSNDECKIKGNINSSGEKIYHLPTGRYYKMTKPEEWFCSEDDAKAAGYRKSQQ